MDVKEAITRARNYLGLVFAEEAVSEVRLEEVSYDREKSSWLVTFGMLRPSERMDHGILGAAGEPRPMKRSYKVVRIPSTGEEPPSIQIREFVGE